MQRAQLHVEMHHAWEHVEEGFDCTQILGPRGAQFVKAHAAQTCNHEFNVTMTLLAAMAPLTNGATVSIFPCSTSPLTVIAVLVGYPQTRKSQMTKLGEHIGGAIDSRIRAAIQAAYLEQLGHEAAAAPLFELASTTLASFTPQTLFERCSGDYALLRNAADIGLDVS